MTLWRTYFPIFAFKTLLFLYLNLLNNTDESYPANLYCHKPEYAFENIPQATLSIDGWPLEINATRMCFRGTPCHSRSDATLCKYVEKSL